MKILVAAVSNASEEIFELHFNSVLAQEVSEGTTIEYAYISDGLSAASEQLVADAGGRVAGALEKPEGVAYEVSETTHAWGEPDFAWLAREKQRLLELADEGGYDGVFFVDSDLVLGPDTLESLIQANKDVTSAVFWTRWTPDSPLLPQVWLAHPYELRGRSGMTYLRPHELMERLYDRELIQVGGLGACTLMLRRVFDRIRWFPLLDGLPRDGMWQGEDRSFCIYATQNHVELWADAWPDIFHIYRPSYIHRARDWSASKPLRDPDLGDWVSVKLECLEDPNIKSQIVRGRLGTLPVLEEIERAVAAMEVGDERIVELEFPAWWQWAQGRKNILVRLIGAKRDFF